VNAFILDEDLNKSVEYHVDKHVVKIGIEACQMLSTALVNNFGASVGYAPVYVNHPLVKWTARSVENWEWMSRYARALFYEYQYRYGREHASVVVLDALDGFVAGINRARWTRGCVDPFYQCVSEELKCDDPVRAYRGYYLKYKARLFSWTKREVPYWIKEVQA